MEGRERGDGMVTLKAGDKVFHLTERWDSPLTIQRIEEHETSFPSPHKELIAFFEEGGFWRVSQLRLADPEPQGPQ